MKNQEFVEQMEKTKKAFAKKIEIEKDLQLIDELKIEKCKDDIEDILTTATWAESY